MKMREDLEKILRKNCVGYKLDENKVITEFDFNECLKDGDYEPILNAMEEALKLQHVKENKFNIDELERTFRWAYSLQTVSENDLKELFKAHVKNLGRTDKNYYGLGEKLKNLLVGTYRKIGDKRALVHKEGNKSSWTGNELADEIEKESVIGVKQIHLLLNLTIDLLKRGKINTPTPPTPLIENITEPKLSKDTDGVDIREDIKSFMCDEGYEGKAAYLKVDTAVKYFKSKFPISENKKDLKDNKEIVICSGCSLVHLTSERIDKNFEGVTTFHCPECNDESTEKLPINIEVEKDEMTTCECVEVHPLKYSVSDTEDGNESCPNCYREFLTDEITSLQLQIKWKEDNKQNAIEFAKYYKNCAKTVTFISEDGNKQTHIPVSDSEIYDLFINSKQSKG